MPDFKTLLNSNKIMRIYAPIGLVLVLLICVFWWFLAVKSRSTPIVVADLSPSVSHDKPASSVLPDVQNATAPPATFDLEPPASVDAENEGNASLVQSPTPVGQSTSVNATNATAQPDVLAMSGSVDEFSRLRTDLERKKLQVEIARQEQTLRDLHVTAASVSGGPNSHILPVRTPRPRPQARVVSISGRGEDLRAVIRQPGAGLVTVAVGDRLGASEVVAVTASGVVVRTGGRKTTLGFE